MHRRHLLVAILILSTLVITGCTTAETAAPTPMVAAPTSAPANPTSTSDAAATIVIGDISDEPVKKIERLQPLADYLAANLEEYGITAGEVKIAPDIDTMIQWMSEGEVDIYIDSVFPAMVVGDGSGAQPILRRWKDQVAEYHSVFFTLAESEAKSLEDMQGHVIAFEDPFSTSGYMLPISYLIEAGLNPVEKPSPDAEVADDEVGYVFSGEDENTLHWVASERILAGATDNGHYEELVEESEVELSVFAETESVARNVVMLRSGVDEEVTAAIKQLMQDLDDVPEGESILVTLETARFDEFPEGTEATFARMRELYNMTQEISN